MDSHSPEMPASDVTPSTTNAHSGEATLTLLNRNFRLICAAEAKPQIEALNRQLDARLAELTAVAGSDPFTVLALAALQLQDEANLAHESAQAAFEALRRAETRTEALTARIDQWLGPLVGDEPIP